MKISANRSLQLMALVSYSAVASVASVACGSVDRGTDDGATSARTGTAGAAGSAAGSGTVEGSAGNAGTGAPGGASDRVARSGAGAPSSGSGGVAGGAGRASAGASSSGSSGAAGAADRASAGAAGADSGHSMGEFGVTSCQPEFETVCRPKIEFVNGDPNGRGKVFTDVVPDVETTMKDISCIVCSMLYRNPSEIPANKHPSTIKLILDTHGGVAEAGGGEIKFDLDYINGYANKSEAETKQEMLGVLQHETVHLFQNYGNNGTGEGMADLVRTRKGYYQRSRWRAGGSWKDAYTTSGFFYSWLTGPCAFHEETLPAHDLNLPYKLNKVLANKQGDAAYIAVNDLFEATFNRDADSLWKEYQDTAF